MKRKKSLKNILLNTTAGVVATVVSVLPNFANAESFFPSKGTDMAPRTGVVADNNSRGTDDLPDDPQHPMYGLNLYVPAWDEDYSTTLDFYGSGDINNDGVINMVDYNSTVTGTDPFNDGTYRGDTDLDGDSGDADDKAIILDYINGNRTHINKWELESATEKESHLVNALAIDPTSEVNATTSGWLCGQYSDQTFINFNGVYDINNSVFANNNGTNLQYDLTHNGIFRVPLRIVDTKTGSNTAHIINNVDLGDPTNQDATEYGPRIYVEPQSDQVQENGDYSLNQYANERWYGYFFNDFLQQWGHFSRDIIDYDLTQTPPIITYQNSDLVISWNPFEDVGYPTNQTHEFPADTSVATNGQPTNLYPGTVYTNTDTSTQTNDSTCSDVTYTVTRSWDGVAGDYNSSNTSGASLDQLIDVEDTTPPTADFPADTVMEYYQGIEDILNASLFAGPTNIQDNSNLPVDSTMWDESTQLMNGTCSQVNFNYYHHWNVSDVCSNDLEHSVMAEIVDTTPPVRDTDGEWSDNSGLPVNVINDTVSTQNPDPTTCGHYNYEITVTETGYDVCNNQGESFTHETEQITNEAPYIVSTPVPNNDTITVAAGHTIHPDSTGWAEWNDPENGPIEKFYDDELIEEDGVHRLWYRTQTANDPCDMSPDSAYHYVYEHKPTGVNESPLEKEVKYTKAYPNPVTDKLNLQMKNDLEGYKKVAWEIYSLNGKLLDYGNDEMYAGEKEQIDVSKYAKGMYMLSVTTDDKTENYKIVKQ